MKSYAGGRCVLRSVVVLGRLFVSRRRFLKCEKTRIREFFKGICKFETKFLKVELLEKGERIWKNRIIRVFRLSKAS